MRYFVASVVLCLAFSICCMAQSATPSSDGGDFISDLQGQVRSLGDEVAKLKKEVAAIAQERDVANNKLKQASEEIQRLTVTLEKSSRDKIELKAEVDQLRDSLAESNQASAVAKKEENGGSANPDQGEPNLSAAQLYSIYKNNEVAADAKFKGQRMCISGRIRAIDVDFIGNPSVRIAIDDFDDVHCDFSKADKPSLASLVAGQEISIEGKCDGLLLGDPVLRECKLP